MLSLSVGHDTAYLTGAVGGGREGYYSAAVTAGEPPGLWYGAGAEALGLDGEVDADLMEAVYASLLDPRDPATHDRSTWGQAALLSAAHKVYKTPEQLYQAALKTEPHADPERRAELRAEAEQKARTATSFIDATFSPHKTYSLAAVAFERASNLAFARGDFHQAALYEEKFRAMEDGILAGARASVDYLQDRAGYGRVGKHGAGGAGRFIDAHGWVVAQFLQHDSREHDPQLHVHQAILNRQLCADGTWRALDSTAIKHWRPAAAAVGERTMEEYVAARAGLRFEVAPDGTGRWLVGVDAELVDQFSKRSHDIDPRTEQLADEFRERYGREPSLHDWTRLAQQATLETRAPKSHTAEDHLTRMDRWEAETQARVGHDLATTAETVLAAGAEPREVSTFSPSAVGKQALAELGQKRSTFREADVTRAVDLQLPAELGCGVEHVRALLDGLTAKTLGTAVEAKKAEPVAGAPAEMLLADGRSVYEAPASRTWTTPEAVLGEQLLRDAAVTRGREAMTKEEAQGFVARYAESGVELSHDKAHALMGVLTSGAMLESITAPGGTGKSYLLGAINDAWTESGRRMMGLATTQVATGIMADEGLSARNISQWLAAQERLAEGRGLSDDEQFGLGPDVIVAVDEASMTSRQDLVAVQQHCDAAGAKLLAVGDQAQLGPVGPGGSLADVAEHGINYQLTQVFRFKQEWEKQASLDLRAGDKAAITQYAKHGRLVDGGTLEETERLAGRAWLSDTLAGKESLLVTASNEAAARVSAQLRAELVALGRVSAEGVRLGLQGTTAGVGDLVQARRNAWGLANWEGNKAAPINRQTYEVTAVRPDGGLTVAPIVERSAEGRLLGDEMQLPANYVDKHMALGYASTAHAAEGRTVDTSHGITGTGMDAAGALVALTRGTDCNTAWTVTLSAPAPDSAPGEVGQGPERTAVGVMLDLLERREIEQGALAEIEQAQRDADSALTNGDRLIDSIGQVLAGRTSAALDQLVVDGTLSEHDRARLAGDEAMRSVDTLLRRAELAGQDPAVVLATAVTQRDFTDADSPAQVLHSRISKGLGDVMTPAVERFADLIPTNVPESWRPWLDAHAEAADDRRAVLGEQIALERPQWAVEALGEVPADPVERLEWEDRAGIAGAVRELLGHEDTAYALGDAPPAGLPEKNAMWRAGHAALGLTAAGSAEREASEGLLRCQVAAQEREEKWAPAYVGHELEAVSLAEARAQETATVLGAKADALATEDPQRAAVLREEALLAAGQLAAMEGQRAALEKSDLDRAKWTAANAATKDRAEAARDELAARGIDLANPPDRTTAAQWVQAHLAEQAVEDPVRPITDEIDLVDPQRDADQAAVSPVTELVEEPGLAETAVADIREMSVADQGEHADPDERRRVPPMAETREKVQRAQEAVAELAAREVLDEAADTPELEGAVARWGDGTEDVRDHTTGDEIREVEVPDVPEYQDADA
jgi:hypothetical protein